MPEFARSINKIAGAWSLRALCNFSPGVFVSRGKNTVELGWWRARAAWAPRGQAWVTAGQAGDSGLRDIPCPVPASETQIIVFAK